MQYWKIVEAGDYTVYARKFLDYYIEKGKYGDPDCSFWRQNNKFPSGKPNTFWNGLRPEKLDEVFTLIPELKAGISKFGEVNEIALLTLYEGETGTLHVDHTNGLNENVRARLQIPVLNTKGTRTAWFELNERQYKNHKVNSIGVKEWPYHYREMIEPVTSVEIVQPTIIRTDAIHTIYFDEPKWPRITLTISFKDDIIKYLDEV